jgi:serine phosphatase RsbU (regulator of sigma subunit)/ligand-binding sensor domain-containing protein
MRTQHFKHLFAATLLTIVFVAGGFAQHGARLGSLSVQNYLPKEYGANPQIFDIVQDGRGVMYFANQRGILEYDGVRWNTIKIGSVLEVNALAVDSSGRVWVGAIGDIGYLKPDAKGTMQFHSVKDQLPDTHQKLGRIKKIHATGNGIIYFQSDKEIITFNKDKVQIIDPVNPENDFHNTFLVDDVLFVRVTNEGLFRYDSDKNKLVTLKSGVVFSNKSVFNLTRFNGQLIAITDKYGIYRFSPDGEVHELGVLKNLELYSGLNINDELYAAGTFSEGLLVLDRNFTVQYHLDINSGMNDNRISCLYLDRENNLWIGTNNGISKVEILSPVSIFGQNTGILSGIEAIHTFAGTVFIAALDGVYYLNFNELTAKKAQKIPGINVDCYGLYPFINNTDSLLLIAAVDGINAYNPRTKEAPQVAMGEPYMMIRGKKNPNRVIVGNNNGLSSLLWANGKFVNSGYIKNFEEVVFNLTIDDNGILWLGTIDNGVFYTTEEIFTDSTIEIKHYTTADGIPEGPVYAEIIDNKPYFATEKGVYELVNGKFKVFNGFGQDFTDGERGVHRLDVDKEGNVWMVLFDEQNNFEIGFAEKNKEGKYIWRSREFSRFSDDLVHAIHHDGNLTWLGGVQGLLRYDSKKHRNYNKTFNTLIRSVTMGSESLFNGSFINDEGIPVKNQSAGFIQEIPYSGKNLTFRFSAVTYVDESRNEYSYILEGQDDEWSDWSKSTQAVYTNVSEGEYTFRVKARNVYGQESEIASYQVTILPPWYRTLWAYIGYGLLLILLVYLAIRFSVRRVQRQKEHLEVIVSERTAEVVLQKEEIEKQKEIVEEKNKDIMDSIKYAKRIQTAILPQDEILSRAFSDAFVLFRPKDIVSGDFYWIKMKEGKSLFAAVDCTGHGVPGAFVSIIGNNGLNRSLNEYNLLSPAEILDRLTLIVEEAFVQEGYDVKDGMDIALCALNREKMVLEYSGANNPMYLIRNGELTEIKADKQPIGQFDRRKPFTNHEIPVQKGDCIFVFSDGYADQFGGPAGKKYKYSTLKKTLIDLSESPMPEIKSELIRIFDDWVQGHEQIDDVCVIGVRV